MSPRNPNLEGTLRSLREDFDRSFARAPESAIQTGQNLLAVHVGGDAYAFRVDEIGGLYTDRRIVAMPSPMPELLGLAGFRGQVAPVYDLGALLGYARRGALRWMVLLRYREPLAFAFDSFDAHLAATADQIVAPVEGAGRNRAGVHVEQAVRIDKAVRPIISLHSVLTEIQKRVDLTRSTKEH